MQIAIDLTEKDMEYLADIIWWIKGYIAAKSLDCETSEFESTHVEALRKIRLAYRDQRNKQPVCDNSVTVKMKPLARAEKKYPPTGVH